VSRSVPNQLKYAAQRASSYLKKYQAVWANIAVPPLLVLLLMLSVTTIAFVLSNNSLKTSMHDEAKQRALVVQQRILTQMTAQAQVLMGSTGRLESAPINRTSWKQYIDAHDIEESFPGIRAVGVAQVVAPDQITAYEAQMSQEYGAQVNVFPRDTHAGPLALLSYIEPSGANIARVVGYDAYSDEERAQAMRTATEENNTAFTNVVKLVNDNNGNQPTSQNPGLIMYRPYYDRSMPMDTAEQRLAAVQGYVFSAIRADTSLARMLSEESTDNTNLTIYVGNRDAENKLYTFVGDEPLRGVVRTSDTFSLYGKDFIVDYALSANSLASATQRNTSRAILAIGALTSLLLSFMTYFLLRTRYERLASEKDREVQLAKDELLSLASHQLRTPATGVKQYVGMVIQGFAGDITKQQEDLLNKAYESNDRQLRIINDILHLAKIDTGRVVLAKTTFDLATMLHDVAEEQRTEAKAGNLALDVKAPKRARYHGDEHMLRMVIENLLSNAIKYTPADGTVSLKLRTTPTSYKISVSDTGVGIDPADYDRLFKQFSRIDNKRSNQVTGTGIGLYLAQHLVNLHKGVITVESTPDVGSTFTVILPRRIL